MSTPNRVETESLVCAEEVLDVLCNGADARIALGSPEYWQLREQVARVIQNHVTGDRVGCPLPGHIRPVIGDISLDTEDAGGMLLAPCAQ